MKSVKNIPKVSTPDQVFSGGLFNPLEYPSIFLQPARLVWPFGWVGHIPFAMFLIEALRPRVLVELGTHSGNSYCAMCQAVQQCMLDTKCYAIDSWEGDEHAGYYGPEVLEDLRAHHDPSYRGFSCLIQSSFDEALQGFGDGTIDLLHIDGCHTYAAVSHDFENWLPKVNENGVILLHDTNVREHGFGVWQLWAELCERYASFEFTHSHGLGLIALSKNQPEPLLQLLNCSREDAASVSTFFSEVGGRLSMRAELQGTHHQCLAETQSRWESDLNEARAAIQDMAAEREEMLASLRDTLSSRDTEIERLRAVRTQLEEDASRKDAAIAELKCILLEPVQPRDEIIRVKEHLAASLLETEQQKTAKELLLSSLSWKITAPLRWIYSHLAAIGNYFTIWRSGVLDAKYYRKSYSGWKIFRFFPLLNQVLWGWLERRTTRSPQPDIDAHDSPSGSEHFEEHIIYSDLQSEIKLIAFYLPQFHPIPENDLWWGKGFTEWTNVVKAKPLFKGHHQPKLPGPLGFYDLRLPEVLQEQIELARQSGIHGFCFHHYWFAGKRLLQRPVEQFLADPSLDFPFCLCWANENWTRRWDGMDNEILIAQNHSAEDDVAFIRDAMRYFVDPRYIRVEGKPIFIVYQPQALPNASATAGRWRDACEREGFGLYLVGAQTFGNYDPRPFSFDAAVQFPPHNVFLGDVEKEMLVADFDGHIRSYNELSRSYMEINSDGEYTLLRCVSPNWDNTARREKSAAVYADSTPEAYRNWLNEACSEAARVHPPTTRFVFINAWNEWAEGAYLEPDREFGYAHLNVTGKVLKNFCAKGNRRNILFIQHDAYQAGAQMVLLHMIRWLKENTNWNLHLMLLADGALLPRYRELLPVWVMDSSLRGRELLEGITAFCGQIDLLYGNTSVVARIYEELRELGVPIITHVHELEASLQRFAGPEALALMRIHTTRYIAPSAPTADNLVHNHDVSRERVEVVHEFIDPTVHGILEDQEKRKGRHDLGLPENQKIVFGCGTIDWRKAPDLFIETARRLRERGCKDVCFCWIGSGTDRQIPDPEALIQQYGLADCVFMLGFKPNPKEYLQVGDVFLLPSREDPFPLVCLEAAECGLPIVCFDGAGGMSGFVGKEVGCVVPHGDLEAMAEALLKLLRDEPLRREMGLAARRKLLSTHISDVEVPRICLVIGKAISSRECHEGKTTNERPGRRVSVIVPNYNYARYIPGRIESILRQTHPVEEIIILDDASTDDSVTVIRKIILGINHIPVVLIPNRVNSESVFRQWKKGMELAGGDYIWIAEADDLAEPRFLERLMSCFDHDGVILAYAESRQIDENGKLIADDYRYYTDSERTGKWDSDYVSSGIEELRTVMAVKNTILNVSGVVFRNGDYQRILEECTEFKVAGDWNLYVNLLQRGDIAYCRESLNVHRRHSVSVTHKDEKENHFAEICRLQDLIAERVPLDHSIREASRQYRREIKRYLDV